MSVTELEILAERIDMIAREAIIKNTSREVILKYIQELANDLQDEADCLAYSNAKEHEHA
jgi:hypothetical protein